MGVAGWWRMKLLMPLIASSAVIGVIACGGETEVIKETVVVEKEVVREVPQTVVVEQEKVVKEEVPVTVEVEKEVVVVQTATPAPTVTPTPPTGKATPAGTVVAAINTVGVPVGTPELCVPGCGNEKYLMSAWDTLVFFTVDGRTLPNLAEWEFASDLSSITWDIRDDVQFHDGWGQLTAEDAAFTLNSVNANTNPDSVHDNTGDYGCCYGETRVIDQFTAQTEITNFDSRAPAFLFSQAWQGVGISSKAVFDEFGKEGMREVFIGSGPFQVVEWIKDDRLILEAVADHWRVTPRVKTARLLAVPEEASRIAMYEAGQADITWVTLQKLQGVKGSVPNTKEKPLGSIQTPISFGPGNYLEKTRAATGEALEQPGLDPSLAWVGDPNAAGCNFEALQQPVPDGPICDELDNARKVRQALAMTIDREGIAEALFAGFAKPSYMTHLSVDNPLFRSEWVIPFDPDRARELLAEAGFADGFKMDMWSGEEVSELAQIVASTWEEELNVKVEFHTSTYATIRPTFVDRTNKWIIFGGWTTDWPVHWPQGREDNSWFFGGTQKYGNLPFSAYTYGEMLTEPDPQKRTGLAQDWYEHENFWRWQPGIYESPNLAIYNGDKVIWEPFGKTTIWWFGMSTIYPLEDVVLR